MLQCPKLVQEATSFNSQLRNLPIFLNCEFKNIAYQFGYNK